jgi:uracil-DNA glycosylase
LGLPVDHFYDRSIVAIVPMGFCFPGTGKSGDLSPRNECAPAWRLKVLRTLPSIGLTVIIGRYALDWHLPESKGKTVTEMVQNWRDYWPKQIVLPHPSPRNNRWLKQNPWFEKEVVPNLQARIREITEKNEHD